MDWFFPLSFKLTLFPAKSSDAVNQTDPIEEEEEQSEVVQLGKEDREEDVARPQDPAVAGPPVNRHQIRRRSSLSDLDTLKEKRSEQQRNSRLTERLSVLGETDRRNTRVFPLLLDGQAQHSVTDYPLSLSGSRGGSIGDMINLKLYGSNRSLVSMTSSIAESVPLETVSSSSRRKVTITSSSSSIQQQPPIDCIVAEQEEAAGGDQFTPMTMVVLPDDEVVIIEEPEEEDVMLPEEEIEALNCHHRNVYVKTERSPSITERALRLSQLIQKKHCRCSRYETDDLAVTK